ncbi:hypothetical protein IEO21_02364 [Rhodonia placenta]|uniref:Vacuolar membrane-associated protein IML1 n=1 Tax=Rhodonia placenta TaxID=104341 RepID=A0A8H7U541_9APHY|nr:hypothetical protein IEO21_02364 [Postia placenta]
MAELDEIHAAGPLRKKVKSDRTIAGMSLSAIVKAMREEGGVPIKDYSWHGRKYANSFKGHDFVSWLVREFRDVSSREEGTKWGASLQEQGLFDHGRQQHGFLDGHYFYILAPEYLAPPTTPRTVWGPFRSRHVSGEESSIKPMTPLEMSTASTPKAKKRLILSQSMVIDVDPNKVSVHNTIPRSITQRVVLSGVTKRNRSSCIMTSFTTLLHASISSCNGSGQRRDV